MPFSRYFYTKIFKEILIIEISTLRPVKRQVVRHKKFRMPYLCNFGLKIFKKFCAKIKIFKIKTKNVLLDIFRLRIGKNDCNIWNQHKTIFGPKMFYLDILG